MVDCEVDFMLANVDIDEEILIRTEVFMRLQGKLIPYKKISLQRTRIRKYF